MKTIYLLRHGESIINTDDVHYHDETAPLSELGKKQAQYVAKRASRLNFDALISSHMARAKETAEYIAEATGHSIEYDELLKEWCMPTSLNGKRRDDPEVKLLAERAIAARDGDGKKVEDSENFEELAGRAEQMLKHWESHPRDTLLAVTHGRFLRMIIARVFFGKNLTPQLFEPFVSGMRPQNTGITVLQFDPNDAHRSWWMLVFNDHGHLG